MVTIISIKTDTGYSRCTELCYLSEESVEDCQCICGGALHGVGLDIAKRRAFKLIEPLVSKYEEHNVKIEGWNHKFPERKRLTPREKQPHRVRMAKELASLRANSYMQDLSILGEKADE